MLSGRICLDRQTSRRVQAKSRFLFSVLHQYLCPSSVHKVFTPLFIFTSHFSCASRTKSSGSFLCSRGISSGGGTHLWCNLGQPNIYELWACLIPRLVWEWVWLIKHKHKFIVCCLVCAKWIHVQITCRSIHEANTVIHCTNRHKTHKC